MSAQAGAVRDQEDRPDDAAAEAYPALVASLRSAPIVRKGDYDYFVHPLSDGIPVVTPAVLEEATAGILRHVEALRPSDAAGADLIVTAEAMGLPLATSVMLATQVPFTTARKRPYGLEGEVSLAQVTGYSENRLHLNGVRAGQRVVIIDDVISTGGTLRALVRGLRILGAEVLGVVSVFSKDPDLDRLAKELDCPLRALVSCRVSTPSNGLKGVEVLATDVQGDA